MTVIDTREAETHFSRLVEAIENAAEKEIVIARNGEPAARRVELADSRPKGERLGLLEGKYAPSTQQEFDAANEEIARLFRGEP
jgi:antitoxin (DNA-binding transcriptional repressor) of toxin-antitoxin stability system